MTNLSDKTSLFSVVIDKAKSSAPSVLFYQVPYVRTGAMEYVADPLIETASTAGFSADQLYIYLFDEIGGKTLSASHSFPHGLAMKSRVSSFMQH